MPGATLTSPFDHPHWPSWWYPPETDPANPAAYGQVFKQPEDVPEGWSCNWEEHGVNLSREPREAPEVVLTRTELRAELTKRDIPWVAIAGKAELQRLLDEALETEALDGSV